jgi:hypothetical protein
MNRRIKAVLAAAAVVAAGQLAFATAASADICHVVIYDETPGTYPGGMHVYTDCLQNAQLTK